MKRLAIAVSLVVCLCVPAVALGHHIARGATKRAVLESISSPQFQLNNGHNCNTLAFSCWRVVISGNAWATSSDIGPNDGTGEFIRISHLIHGRWRSVGGWGEGIGFACRREGMSRGIAKDLHVYCS